MEGASTDGSAATALPEAPAAFVRHPTGLTFRTYIFVPEVRHVERITSGKWEESAQEFIESAFGSDPTCSRPVFIDGGAAFGIYSLLAAFRNPCREVYAFNPHPKFAAAMQHNIDDNVASRVLQAPKICINRLALAREEGMTDFDFGYNKGIRDGNPADRTRVKMTSLDAWAEQHLPDSKQILMVKLDLEGYELNVLRGATELLRGCRVKFWAIGIHPERGVRAQDVAAILRRNGYTIDSSSAAARGQPNGDVQAHC